MSALKQVFVRVHARYEQDRYAQDLERFAAWLLAAGYPNKTCRTHLYRTQQALHVAGRPPDASIDEALLRRVFHRLAQRRWRHCHTLSVYAGFLRSVHRLTVDSPAPLDPRAVAVEEFCERLSHRHGLRATTIANYRHWIEDFFRLGLPLAQPLGDITGTTVESYLHQRAPTMAASTLREAIKCISAFLKDCHERGRLATGITPIELPRGFRPERPPRAMPWVEVERLLDSIDRKCGTGTRDHLILHLMSHYGIRTGEIALLRLEAINWKARTLTLWQSKINSTLVLPLHDQTLCLLKDYLAGLRPPAPLPWLFLSGSAPWMAMTKYSVSAVFRTRARRSGLPLSQYSSYSLRHAFAQRLFLKGVGMKAIGDLMGHRNLVSTSVYLRLQSSMLREVALPMPAFEQAGGAA